MILSITKTIINTEITVVVATSNLLLEIVLSMPQTTPTS